MGLFGFKDSLAAPYAGMSLVAEFTAATGGYGHWGRPEPLPPAAVTGARLTTAGGKALATASFSRPG